MKVENKLLKLEQKQKEQEQLIDLMRIEINRLNRQVERLIINNEILIETGIL